MSKSKKLTIIISSALVILLVAILGTIFDLQISKLLADLPAGQYYSSNVYALIGEWFGEDILYLFLISSCAIIFFYMLKFPLKNKWLNIGTQTLMCVASYIISAYSFYKTLRYIARYTASLSNLTLTNYLNSAIGIITVFLIAIIISVVIFLLISKLKPETLSALWKWAVVVLVVAVISNGIVQLSKQIFDRTRYRAMVYAGDEEFNFFTYWFTINSKKPFPDSLFIGDYYKSFPSGHTCAATSVFLLVLLPFYLKELDTKRNKIILYAVAVCYTLLIAVSRIVAGAHFFMDTFIASFITIVSVFVVHYLFKFILKKYFSTQIVSKSTNQSIETTINKNEEVPIKGNIQTTKNTNDKFNTTKKEESTTQTEVKPTKVKSNEIKSSSKGEGTKNTSTKNK